MRTRLLLVVASSLLVTLGVVLARPAPQEGGQAQATTPATSEPLRELPDGATAIRLLLGVGDAEVRDWSGRVSVAPGEVVGVEGWRLRGGAVTGRDSWRAQSLVLRKAATKKAALGGAGAVAKKKGAAAKKKAAGAGGQAGALHGPTGVIVHVKAGPDAVLVVATGQGEARIPLGEVLSGGPRRYLDGRIEAQAVPVHAPLALGPDLQEDLPAAASDGKDGAWVAYLAHAPRGPVAAAPLTEPPASFKGFIPSGGGDQVRLAHFDGRRVVANLEVTGPGRDAWRPAVAARPDGTVAVVWSENIEGNWDLYTRTYNPAAGTWTGPARLTTDPGADTDPALATDAKGRILIAWQAWRDGEADILAGTLDPGGRLQAANISKSPANDWHPAIAAGMDGELVVAFDSYRNGNYDVFLYESGSPDRLVAVTDSTRFEARPTLGVDRQGRAWVAYEERTDNWGKDFGVHDRNAGTPLYQASAVRVRCVQGDQVLDAGDPVAAASAPQAQMNSFPRLAVDAQERVWLLFRNRGSNVWRDSPVPIVGATWTEFVTTLSGKSWTPPQPLPRSDNLLDNRPALAVGPGRVLVAYSTDGRMHREGQGAADGGGAPANVAGKRAGGTGRVVDNDLFLAALTPPSGLKPPQPGVGAARLEPAQPAHPDEAEDVARMRAYRLTAGGKSYQLLRGEFHRHTEISPDGGGDGALEDMWRYALDAGGLDWIGNGDHDNGNGREYTWWMTQKTTDLYHHAGRFTPMFTYERSVPYPGGHRNVMFPYRGVRTLPRLQGEGGAQIDVNGRDLDAAMLYRYLNELGGLCASHTSGTDMGTDWRANDPNAEPIVEIYQGDRDSYEHLGAPRVAHNAKDAPGGWRPLGMVWNALALQYRLGFQSSSDHISTHISFAVALAEEPTRKGIYDAFKKRHCYAATDNILLDVRCGEHLMGDEFAHDGPVTIQVKAHGTRPIAKVDIIKDFHYVYSTEPKAAEVKLAWTDESGVNRGPSWYYVRIQQEDGEIAWASPMWVHAGTANGR
jgi:hypothetical protein